MYKVHFRAIQIPLNTNRSIMCTRANFIDDGVQSTRGESHLLLLHIWTQKVIVFLWIIKIDSIRIRYRLPQIYGK